MPELCMNKVLLLIGEGNMTRGREEQEDRLVITKPKNTDLVPRVPFPALCSLQPLLMQGVLLAGMGSALPGQ